MWDISLILSSKIMARRGNPRLDESRNNDTTAANLARIELADAYAVEVLSWLRDALNEDNVGTHAERAKWLNTKGFKTRRGNAWTKRAVARLVARAIERGLRIG